MSKLSESVNAGEVVSAGYGANVGLGEALKLHRASAVIQHSRPTRWIKDAVTGLDVPDPESYELLHEETSHNVKTTVGIDFIFLQSYGDAGLGANGLNYIALSDDALTETTASTTLSNEIVANGLQRAQGTYAHTPAAATATITKVFTATGSQAAQKAALFSAAVAGTMNHVLAFTQRSLISGDTLSITYTITLT